MGKSINFSTLKVLIYKQWRDDIKFEFNYLEIIGLCYWGGNESFIENRCWLLPEIWNSLSCTLFSFSIYLSLFLSPLCSKRLGCTPSIGTSAVNGPERARLPRHYIPIQFYPFLLFRLLLFYIYPFFVFLHLDQPLQDALGVLILLTPFSLCHIDNKQRENIFPIIWIN